MRLKTRALFGNFAHRGQAENLISAAIGENRPVPAHKSMQPAEFPDQLSPGAQIEVISVAQQNLAAEILEVPGQDRFHRTLSADRHECRGFYNAVGRHETAESGPACGGLFDYSEMHASGIR